MRHVIVGPNLDDQSKGQFECHKEGCGHLNRIKYLGGSPVEQDWVIDATSKQEVVEEIYQDIIEENQGESDMNADNWTGYEQEVHFAPCCELNRSFNPEIAKRIAEDLKE